MTSLESVAAVIDALNRLPIAYMLVGSFSSNAYGIPRMTKDADFVVQLGQTPVSVLVDHLGSEFRLDPQVTFETITATVRYRIEHTTTGFTIEFFELSPDPHDQQRFARRRKATLLGRTVFLPTAEDVIVTKLRWSKGGNRRKDVEDVENVIAVQRDALDLDYIRRWCDQHATRELFDRLWTESRV